ncbi:hypothetical protein [Rhodonellum ikkaensis]|nr:hypothetical protein [Rhodonellum ikkaensis]
MFFDIHSTVLEEVQKQKVLDFSRTFAEWTACPVRTGGGKPEIFPRIGTF